MVIGYLIFRSTFLPPILGVLVAVAGLAWATFLSPALANNLSPYNLGAGLLGEILLGLWLLVVGINVRKWRAKAVPRG
jgi:ABC-type thiamin/hydroxymethylpyrimidine transport system permease subunit